MPEAEVVANTRKGKQVMNVKSPDEAVRCVTVAGDHVAIVGENRKMLVFPLIRDPGDGARQGRAPAALQGWRRARRQDVRARDGLTWQDTADRTLTRSAAELTEWLGDRASAGRLVPKGFPRSGKFG